VALNLASLAVAGLCDGAKARAAAWAAHTLRASWASLWVWLLGWLMVGLWVVVFAQWRRSADVSPWAWIVPLVLAGWPLAAAMGAHLAPSLWNALAALPGGGLGLRLAARAGPFLALTARLLFVLNLWGWWAGRRGGRP